MVRTASSLYVVLVLTGVGAAQVRNKVNPIQRVVNLRQAKKIAAVMQQEAALHPHFECCCRSTGQELKTNAEDGSARIAFGGVELKTLINVLKESREEAKEALAIEGAPVGKVAFAFDAESSDLAANIVALTRAIAALEKGVVGSSFLSDPHPSGFLITTVPRCCPFGAGITSSPHRKAATSSES